MNRTALLAAIAVLVTSLGAPAGAKDRDDRDDRGRSSQGHSDRSNNHDRRDQRAQRNHQRQPQAAQRPHERQFERQYPRQYERQYERQYPRQYPRQVQRRPGERGAGPDRNFFRGTRLPAHDHNRYAVVDDWRGHRLNQPPRGYHWVQTGGDYVLVAIATGIILQLILNN